MGIIYAISIIYLFITIILYKKSEEKISFLKFFSISIVCFLCWNTLICFIMSTIGIPISFISLSCVNIVLGSIFLFFIIKKKDIQKYSLELKNIIAVGIIAIVCIILTILNLGNKIEIKYVATDAAVHFAAAKDFYKNDALLDKVEDTDVSSQFMIAAYVNTGILFKLTAPIVGECNLYKIFILFDVFSMLLLAVLVYCAVEKVIKSNIKFILSLIMIVFFMIGYPLNSFVCGYVYLQLGLIIIATIINVLQYYCEEFDRKIIYSILSICNFTIFFTYCIFVPIVYIVEFIYLVVKEYKNNKKIISMKNIVLFSTIFLLPIICGVYYYVIPYLLSVKGEDAFIYLDGYIYRNCWSNFIFILPMALFCLKKKNDDTFVWKIFTSFLVLSMIILFTLVNKLNLSAYYYYKFNYILWYLLWYGAIYAINVTESKINKFLHFYLLIYVTFAIAAIGFKTIDITKETFDSDENYTNAFDIYCINRKIMFDFNIDYTIQELDLLEYIHDNIELDKQSNRILLIMDSRQEYWFWAFFNYKNRNDIQATITKKEVDKWNNNEYKYLLVLYESNYYNQYKGLISYKRLLKENEAGAVYINE